MVAKDPLHLYIGLYEDLEKAEHDFDGLVALHRQGLVAAFDAAVIERGEDGTPGSCTRSGRAITS